MSEITDVTRFWKHSLTYQGADSEHSESRSYRVNIFIIAEPNMACDTQQVFNNYKTGWLLRIWKEKGSAQTQSQYGNIIHSIAFLSKVVKQGWSQIKNMHLRKLFKSLMINLFTNWKKWRSNERKIKCHKSGMTAHSDDWMMVLQEWLHIFSSQPCPIWHFYQWLG